MSIKPHVLKILEREYPYLQKRYGVRLLRLFGAVSKAEDTKESDIDLLYILIPEMDTYDNLFDLHEYLENLFGRKVDLVPKSGAGSVFSSA